MQKFLCQFHSDNSSNSVFTKKCCYWFAVILFGRFIRDGATIMYDKNKNYFGTKIHDRVYDITGDITEEFEWESWTSIEDTNDKQIIIRNHIMF